jgi:adenylate cyclase, class 2
LVYDETPIGNFVELEGPPRWINEVAQQLGYARTDYITASYGTLYRRWCEGREEEPGDLIFPNYKT